MRWWIALFALTSLARADEKPVVKVKACEMISIEPLAFQRGRAEISRKKERALDHLAHTLQRPEILSIEVTGHAMRREDPALARARAEAVIAALVARGVDRSHLSLSPTPGRVRRPCVDFRSAMVHTPTTEVLPGYRKHSFVVLWGCDQLH